MKTLQAKPYHLWLVLVSRTALFALFQAVITGLLSLTGTSTPWDASAAWWTVSALMTNLVSISLLAYLFHQETQRYFGFIPVSPRQPFWKDLGSTLLLAVLLMPLATLPGQWLASWLYGSADIPFARMAGSLPRWAFVLSLLFPLTIAFAELPTYFGYLMPRLERLLDNSWLAWALASFFLALQHITLPLIFDLRFIAWRLGMFMPLAFLMGLCLKLRPRLFPHLMIIHALMDMAAVVMQGLR